MNQRPDMEDMRQGFQDRRPVYRLIWARTVKMVEIIKRPVKYVIAQALREYMPAAG